MRKLCIAGGIKRHFRCETLQLLDSLIDEKDCPRRHHSCIGIWDVTADGSKVPEECTTCARLRSVHSGYRHIDTAQHYGNEEEVGAALQETSVHQADIFLSTKVTRAHLAPDSVQSSFGSSLRKLQTEYADLLIIHWPRHDVPLGATLDARLELQRQRKTRRIGVSNFTPSLLARALDHALVFAAQVECHPFLSQSGTLEMARVHDLLFTAYSPLAGGLWSNEVDRRVERSRRSRPRTDGFRRR